MSAITYSLQKLRGDLFGGITAAVVALPVALAFGAASGVGPIAGLYSAIAVGFFAAVFGGTSGQVSGPTGPMTVVMAVIVAQTATTLAEAFTVVMLGGIMQILLGALRIGRFIVHTPYSVISGFMSGIGVIVILLQTLPLLGAGPAQGGPVEVVRTWPAALAQINIHALVVGLLTLGLLVLWPRRLDRLVPGHLVALLAGTLVAVHWLDAAPVIGSVPTGLPSLHWPTLSVDYLLRILQPAFILALLGSIDSLLTSLAADSITRTTHNADRELVGQGIGNVAAGLIGALPGAGSTVTTMVNVRSGGRTLLAGVLVAALLTALVLGAGKIAEPIPLAVLAGILLRVGWQIIDWRFIMRIRQIERGHLAVMLLTLGLTVFVDLLTAVALGLIVAGVVSAQRSQQLELDSVISVPLLSTEADIDPYLPRVGLVALRGRFSVASSSTLARIIGADIEGHDVVIFDFSETTYMDDSAVMVIKQLVEGADEENTACIAMGLRGSVATEVHSLGALDELAEDHFVDTLDEAKQLATRLLED